MRDFLDEAVFFGAVFLGGVVFIAVIIMTVGAIGNRIGVIGDMEAIEQLRRDVKHIDLQSNEDVMGKVADWNMRIVSERRYNQMWLFDWTIPDRWDTIELINVEGKGG